MKRKNLICLSATKDVQDAILQNPKYNQLIDVIDIKYWAYREDGSLYAPEGGIHLAPRQNARLESPGKRSFESVYRSVSEYRQQYPDKAVIYSENQDPRWGWAVFMAGGSLPPVMADMPQEFYTLAATLHPETPEAAAKCYALKNTNSDIVFYVEPKGKITHNLDRKKVYMSYFTNEGKQIKQERFKGKKMPFTYQNDTDAPVIICVHQQVWEEKS